MNIAMALNGVAVNPTINTLARYAQALGKQVEVRVVDAAAPALRQAEANRLQVHEVRLQPRTSRPLPSRLNEQTSND